MRRGGRAPLRVPGSDESEPHWLAPGACARLRPVSETPYDTTLWPLELARLQVALGGEDASQARDHARGAFWRLLFQALVRFLRIHSRSADASTLEDIAAERIATIKKPRNTCGTSDNMKIGYTKSSFFMSVFVGMGICIAWLW